MKNKTFLESIKCAIIGFKYAYTTEKNFIYYTIIAVIFFIANIILKSTLLELSIFFITAFAVFGAEFANTAIEHLCDYTTNDFNNKIKIVKDIAAATVLAFGIGFFIAQGLILTPKLL